MSHVVAKESFAATRLIVRRRPQPRPSAVARFCRRYAAKKPPLQLFGGSMLTRKRLSAFIVVGILPLLLTAALLAQQAWTAAEDHQNMMAQLGIRKLRPGPSGNESAPNHANYDEATANPFPNLPEVLTLKNGKKVTSAQMWWNERRPEILEDF